MKIDIQILIALIGVIGAIIIGYGQLTGQISGMELRISHLELMAEKAYNLYTGS